MNKFDSEGGRLKLTKMRVSRRRTAPSRTRALPSQSRLTVRRAVATLRRGREALVDLEGQLDGLLRSLSGDSRLDGGAADRLARTTREAGTALSALAELRRLLPQQG